jgi:carboxyl-terminal processing protease
MKLARLLLSSVLVAGAGCLDRVVGTDPSSSPSALFDIVWNDFDRNYAMFGVKDLDWNEVYARHKPAADSATTAEQVAVVIGRMFTELNDQHVDLMVGSKVYRSVDFSTIHTYFSFSAIRAAYVPTSSLTAGEKIRYGRISPDVGWIWIPSFAGNPWPDEVDEALRALSGVTAIIIDVRNNGGGSTRNSGPIAGRFVDAERVFAYFQYRNGPRHEDLTELRATTVRPAGLRFTGKVVVLTNRKCASATESFVLSLRVQPGIVFVGDTTAGALGNPLTRELPNGWEYRLPQWIQFDAALRAVENIGIAPDVVVKYSAADSLAGRDPQLERALAIAQGKN